MTRQVCRERGVTLIEMLIVLALFGMMALIGTIQINKTWQRYRLESTASEMRTFVQDASLYIALPTKSHATE